MKKIKNPWLSKPGYDCFGCCPENPQGVAMEFFEDGDEIICFWKPQSHYQGWINTLHGGIHATLIYECASLVVFRKLQTTGVTSKLEVKYRKPVNEMRRNVAYINVCIENSHGELCAEGEAVYFTFPAGKAR